VPLESLKGQPSGKEIWREKEITKKITNRSSECLWKIEKQNKKIRK